MKRFSVELRGMNDSTQSMPLTRWRWIWERTKTALILGVFLPLLFYTLNEIQLGLWGQSGAFGFLLIAGMLSIFPLWLVAPGVISYIHSIVTATDKTSGSLMGLGMMAVPLVLFILPENTVTEKVVALAPGAILLGVLGFFGMLRTAGPKDSILYGTSCLSQSPSKALHYFQAAAFTEEYRPTLLSISAELVQAGQSYHANALAEHLTRVAPREANNWLGRSYVAYHTGKEAHSFQYIDEALKLEPNNAEIYYNRAVRRSKSPDEYELSLKDYTKAISLDGKQARYFANRAALYNRMERHESALSDAKKAHQLDPADRVAAAQATLALTELGREDELEEWMGGGSRLAEMLASGKDSDFERAISLYQTEGDSSALKANYPGETITVIGPDGVRQIKVDELP